MNFVLSQQSALLRQDSDKTKICPSCRWPALRFLSCKTFFVLYDISATLWICYIAGVCTIEIIEKLFYLSPISIVWTALRRLKQTWICWTSSCLAKEGVCLRGPEICGRNGHVAVWHKKSRLQCDHCVCGYFHIRIRGSCASFAVEWCFMHACVCLCVRCVFWN